MEYAIIDGDVTKVRRTGNDDRPVTDAVEVTLPRQTSLGPIWVSECRIFPTEQAATLQRDAELYDQHAENGGGDPADMPYTDWPRRR